MVQFITADLQKLPGYSQQLTTRVEQLYKLIIQITLKRSNINQSISTISNQLDEIEKTLVTISHATPETKKQYYCLFLQNIIRFVTLNIKYVPLQEAINLFIMQKIFHFYETSSNPLFVLLIAEKPKTTFLHLFFTNSYNYSIIENLFFEMEKFFLNDNESYQNLLLLQDRQGYTVLHSAIQNAKPESLQLLINVIMNVFASTKERLKIFFNTPNQFNCNPLNIAAQSKTPHAFRESWNMAKQISANDPAELKNYLANRDSTGFNPIHRALFNNSILLIESMLSAAVEVVKNDSDRKWLQDLLTHNPGHILINKAIQMLLHTSSKIIEIMATVLLEAYTDNKKGLQDLLFGEHPERIDLLQYAISSRNPRTVKLVIDVANIASEGDKEWLSEYIMATIDTFESDCVIIPSPAYAVLHKELLSLSNTSQLSAITQKRTDPPTISTPFSAEDRDTDTTRVKLEEGTEAGASLKPFYNSHESSAPVPQTLQNPTPQPSSCFRSSSSSSWQIWQQQPGLLSPPTQQNPTPSQQSSSCSYSSSSSSSSMWLLQPTAPNPPIKEEPTDLTAGILFYEEESNKANVPNSTN